MDSDAAQRRAWLGRYGCMDRQGRKSGGAEPSRPYRRVGVPRATSTRCARSVEARARRPISPDRVRGGRAPLDIRSCETKLSKDKLFYGPRIESTLLTLRRRGRVLPPGRVAAARGHLETWRRAVVLRVACDCARQRDRTADLVTSRFRRLSTPRRYTCRTVINPSHCDMISGTHKAKPLADRPGLYTAMRVFYEQRGVVRQPTIMHMRMQSATKAIVVTNHAIVWVHELRLHELRLLAMVPWCARAGAWSWP